MIKDSADKLKLEERKSFVLDVLVFLRCLSALHVYPNKLATCTYPAASTVVSTDYPLSKQEYISTWYCKREHVPLDISSVLFFFFTVN